MSFRLLLAVLMVSFWSQAEVSAQIYRPLKSTARVLGVWHGTGRHWQNKGPDVGYYNPWTEHNSGLVTRGYVLPPRSNSFSNYGHQNYYSPQQQYQPVQTQPIPSPLGGSYEKFEDEDDEDLNTIEPIDGADDEDEELGENDLGRFYKPRTNGSPTQEMLEMPDDALSYSVDSQTTEKAIDSARWQEIK